MSEDRFEFEECIGTGGFGVVYRARMTTAAGLVRTVAVKALRADVTSASAVARLRDEARLLAALRHRAILAVHDLVMLDGCVALVSEYIEGADLAQLVTGPSGPLPPRVALEVVGDVAGALASAWSSAHPVHGRELNLVHRDIKPANIRISRQGAVKLLDFGIAKSESVSRDAMTGTGMLVGTVGYLSPDRFTEETVLPASDVYALGIVLFEVVTASRLFGQCERRELMRMAVDQEFHDEFVAEALERLAPLGAEVRTLVADMLKFDPGERPTALQVEARAEDLADQLGGMRLRKWARNHAWETPAGLEDPRVGRTMTGSGLLDNAAPGPAAPDPATNAGEDPGAPTLRTEPSRSRLPGLVAALAAAAVVAGGLFGVLSSDEPAAPAAPAAVTRPVPQPPPTPKPEPQPQPKPKPEPKPEPKPKPKPKPKTQREPTAAPKPDPAPDPPAAPSTVTVTLSSLPLGAQVELFGRVVCTTPCSTEVPVGSHLVKFSLADGRTAQEVINVSETATTFGHRFAPQ